MSDDARAKLEPLLDLLAERSAPSSVRFRDQARKVHIDDSLSALEVEALASATRIADVGSGAGLPGLALAAALPQAEVSLIEANRRKCGFIARAIDACGLENAAVVCERAETWAESAPHAGGRESCDAVTARAVGRLSTIAELASPLLAAGGVLVAWKGRRDPDEEAEMERAAAELGIEPIEIRAVGPYAGSRHRHLHVMVKVGPTPDGLPRRPGIAKKRPRGAHRRAR